MSLPHVASDVPKTIDCYQIGESLGRGAFGTVYKALNFETGETVAIKRIALTQLPVQNLAAIETELELLQTLNHPNIVQYIGLFRSENHLNVVLEYVEGGSLLNTLKKFGNFSESLTSVYSSQLLEGLAHLHGQGVIHRDIKASNLLTTKNGLLKLADFGVSTAVKLHNTKELCDMLFGSSYWMAPEVISMDGVYFSSDIWSVGCTILELLTGEPPFYSMPQMSAMYHIVESNEKPPYPSHISADLKNFLDKCFERDPNLRSSSSALLEHPWIVSRKNRQTRQVVNWKSSRWLSQSESMENVLQSRAVLRSCGSSTIGLADELAELSNLQEKLEILHHQVISEVREIQLLEDSVKRLDKKIELLIRNRISIDELVKSTDIFPSFDKKNALLLSNNAPLSPSTSSIYFWRNTAQAETLGKIFYLLQIRPQYLTNLMFFNLKSVEGFIETLILTLFGYAFSPREEYLLLQLFEFAIEKEVSNLTSIDELSEKAQMLLLMIMAYSRRVEEKKFLCYIFGPCVDKVVQTPNLNFEYNHRKVFNRLVSFHEVRTGRVDRMMSDHATDTEVSSNVQVIRNSCEAARRLVGFVDYFCNRIIDNKELFPYGLRYVLKVLERELNKKFPNQSERITMLLGNIVYYRFMNPAIIVPENFQMITVTPQQRSNLADIGRVISNIANKKLIYGNTQSVSIINECIQRNSGKFSNFLQWIVQKIPDPAEFLDVDEVYLEYTLTMRPVIYISPSEMLLLHRCLSANIDNIAPDLQDDLRMLVKSLSLPNESFEDLAYKHEVPIMLLQVSEKTVLDSRSSSSDANKIYLQTKKRITEIIKGSFKNSLNELDLLELLTGSEVLRNEELNATAHEILENLKYLESQGLVSKSNHYKDILMEIQRDLWQKVALNSKLLNDQRKMQNTLQKLKEKRVVLENQLDTYNDYVKACMEQMVLNRKKKNLQFKQGERRKFVKFSCSNLRKKGVIVEIQVPTSQQASLSFEIEESANVGIFFVNVYAASFLFETITIELADLLEKQDNNVYYLELMDGKVKLRLNLLIHILNKISIV